jgi:hypothetical protein
MSPALTAAGMALFQGSRILARVDGLHSPPNGFEYHAWLSASGGSPFLHLGAAALDDGVLTVHFQGDQDADLLGTFDTLLVSLEQSGSQPPAPTQLALSGAVDTDILEAYRAYLQHTGSGMDPESLLQDAEAQAVRLSDHLDFTLEALAASDLAAAKMHSEHIINLAVGRLNPDFQDWDGNGRVESPGGDEFGMIPYLRVISELLLGVNEEPDNEDEAQTLAAELHRDIADGLIPQTEQATAAAMDITGADSLNLIGALGVDGRLNELRDFDTLVASTLQRIQQAGLVNRMGLMAPLSAVSQP